MFGTASLFFMSTSLLSSTGVISLASLPVRLLGLLSTLGGTLKGGGVGLRLVTVDSFRGGDVEAVLSLDASGP